MGRNLAKKLWFNHKDKYNLIGSGLSPNKISNLKSLRRGWNATYNDIPIHLIDIVHDNHKLEHIFQENKIDYVNWFKDKEVVKYSNNQ